MANCLLVYLPGTPLRVSDLMPQEELALAAASIRHAGHTPLILDFGSIFEADAPAAPIERNSVFSFLSVRDASAESTVAAIVARIQGVIRSFRGGLDLVAFLVQERDGLAMSTQVNLALQRERESPRAVCFGSYAERFGTYISAYNPAFDACVAEEAGAVLSGILDAPDLGWTGMPGLTVRDRNGTAFTGRIARPDRTSPRPLPDYSEAVYPQLYNGEKLRYFPVKLFGNAAAGPSVMGRARQITAQFPGAAIHFACDAAQREQIEALARGVGALEGFGACSLSLQVPVMAQLAPEILRSMSCRAVKLDVHSGSQRLLDDFFSAGFTVTEVEAACRGARLAGAALHTAFAFPCPWDDQHTEAETLRVVQRTRPDGVTLRATELTPGTPWYADPARYGFRLHHRLLARQAACAPTPSRRRNGVSVPENARALGGAIRALGVETGVSVYELACARVLDAERSNCAGALRDTLAHAGHEELRATLSTVNAALQQRPMEDMRDDPGRIRAVIGN